MTPTVLPTSASVSVYVLLVAPLISTPDASHWYENNPMPSRSASDVFAVKVCLIAAVPVIVTPPETGLLRAVTIAV